MAKKVNLVEIYVSPYEHLMSEYPNNLSICCSPNKYQQNIYILTFPKVPLPKTFSISKSSNFYTKSTTTNKYMQNKLHIY